MSGYHGWLYFKNETTQERLACPAAAVERERGRAGARMALVFKSPVTGEIGEWEELRHGVFASGRLEEARQWSPVSFFVQDPETRAALETAVASSLSASPEEARKTAPDRLARRIRMDDWARGWALDLMWDPFHKVEPNSHAKLRELVEGGELPPPADEGSFGSWLAQDTVIQSPAQAPAEPVKPQAAEIAAAPIDESDPFGPSNTAAPAAPPAPVAQASRPVAPAPAPSPEPVSVSVPAPAAEPVAAIEQPETPPETDFEPEPESDVDRLAREIFTAPDMPSFSDIARSAAASLSRGGVSAERPAPDAHANDPQANQATEPARAEPEASAPPAPAAPPSLAFRCVKLPAESSPGRPIWHSALFLCDSFLKKENFEIVKKHWQGSYTGGAKKASLYSIDALQELHAAGNAISLDGLLAGEGHTLAAAGGERVLDAETFALHAFHQNPSPEAQGVAARAKREIIWARLGTLMSHMEPCEAPAEFEPQRFTRDASSSGEGMGVWIDPARGLVKTQQWSDATASAQLVDLHLHSADARLAERLRSSARQLAALPDSDPPEPADAALFLAPFTPAEVASRSDWKASQRKGAGGPAQAPSEPSKPAKMSA